MSSGDQIQRLDDHSRLCSGDVIRADVDPLDEGGSVAENGRRR
jgi:hypothetical protein